MPYALNRSSEGIQYMRRSIQEWNKQNLFKIAFKKLEVIWSASLQIF